MTLFKVQTFVLIDSHLYQSNYRLIWGFRFSNILYICLI